MQRVDQQKVRLGIGKHHPFIFLNACQVGASGNQLSLRTGWPECFLNIGASACVAPLWSVNDARAKKVAEDFYAMTRDQGMTLSQALRETRKQWVQGTHLTYLAYVLYGDPAARINWQTKPAESGTNP